MFNSFRIHKGYFKLILFIGIYFFYSIIYARVFDFNKENVAMYFGGSYGPSSQLKQTHFNGTSGTGATIDKSNLTNYSGEYGVLFRSPKVGLRFSVELIKPETITKGVGSDTNGVKLYDFESSISALIPKISLEINLKSSASWRSFLTIGGGTASVSYKNSYTLTTDGQAAFSGVSDFSEEGVGTAAMYDGGLNFETLMNDTTTVSLSLGYRQLKILHYKYKADVSSFSGAHLKEDNVLNDDGSDKTSSFSGPVIGLLFRFYLGK